MYNNEIQKTMSLVNHKKAFYFRLLIQTSFYFSKKQELFFNN